MTLTDEQLDIAVAPFEDDTGSMYGLDKAAPLIPIVIAELRSLRSQALTAEEVEALKFAHAHMEWLATGAGATIAPRAAATLSRLISQGAKP
jgi:hypothetical protein